MFIGAILEYTTSKIKVIWCTMHFMYTVGEYGFRQVIPYVELFIKTNT